jgi:hypothetical protein
MASSHHIFGQLGAWRLNHRHPRHAGQQTTPEGKESTRKGGSKRPTRFHKLVDIPPKDSAGESSIGAGADEKEGGIVRNLVEN